MLKFVIFIISIQIAVSYAGVAKDVYMIKNKKTGLVLEGEEIEGELVKLTEWRYRKTQLWTFEPTDKPGYSYFYNFATGHLLDASPTTKVVLTYRKHGEDNQRWLLNTYGDKRLSVAYYPDYFLIYEGGNAVLNKTKRDDDSDRWLWVKPESLMKPMIKLLKKDVLSPLGEFLFKIGSIPINKYDGPFTDF